MCRLCAIVVICRDLWGSADPSRGQGIAARLRRDVGCLTDAIVSGKCTLILVAFVLSIVLHLLLVRLGRGVAGCLCAGEILAMGSSAPLPRCYLEEDAPWPFNRLSTTKITKRVPPSRDKSVPFDLDQEHNIRPHPL